MLVITLPVYEGAIAGFHGGQLARVVLELLGLKRGFLVCIERFQHPSYNMRCALDLFIHASNVDSARADLCKCTIVQVAQVWW